MDSNCLISWKTQTTLSLILTRKLWNWDGLWLRTTMKGKLNILSCFRNRLSQLKMSSGSKITYSKRDWVALRGKQVPKTRRPPLKSRLIIKIRLIKLKGSNQKGILLRNNRNGQEEEQKKRSWSKNPARPKSFESNTKTKNRKVLALLLALIQTKNKRYSIMESTQWNIRRWLLIKTKRNRKEKTR